MALPTIGVKTGGYTASAKPSYLDYQGSNAWAGFGMAGIGTDLLSGYMQLQSAEQEANAYKFKADRIQLAGQFAKMQADYNNVLLQKRFNETQAVQNVMFAVQGRTGGTVANIARQDAENLAWDMEFMKQSGIIEQAGYEMDAAQSRIAAVETMQSARKAQAIGLLSTGLKAATMV